jgi:hypothetical protein
VEKEDKILFLITLAVAVLDILVAAWDEYRQIFASFAVLILIYYVIKFRRTLWNIERLKEKKPLIFRWPLSKPSYNHLEEPSSPVVSMSISYEPSPVREFLIKAVVVILYILLLAGMVYLNTLGEGPIRHVPGF